MIEPIVYFGIGFLLAALVALIVIPFVHGRAVRLTMRRLTAVTPLLGRTRDECDRLVCELGNMKREAEEAWASERMENALLRQRINDITAEVARLTSALEGPNPPIEATLIAETTMGDRAVSNGQTTHGDAPSSNGYLASRIRALQGRASRVHGDTPSNFN